MGNERATVFVLTRQTMRHLVGRAKLRAFVVGLALCHAAHATVPTEPAVTTHQSTQQSTPQQGTPQQATPPAAPTGLASGSSATGVARLWMESVTSNAQASLPKGRISIEVGELDPRLKLAPCARIEPYLPAGQRAWGKVRVGLRCTVGPVAWNVFLPVTVRIWARAVVTTGPVAAEAQLGAGDLTLAEVDLAERPAPSFDRVEDLLGRKTAVALAPGATVRSDVLKLRQWFGAGDTVAVVAVGSGFNIASEAQALSPGLDGQPVRLRTESGRIITGTPVAERRAELRL